MYGGNMINCYTQAVLSTMMTNFSYENLKKFEIATSVPFGIVYKPNDNNRLLDCYLDPDIGIEVAFELLSIPFESICYNQKDYPYVIEILNSWLRESPVLLGPIDMGELVYLPHHQLLLGVDHYIVIMKQIDDYTYEIMDPEGNPYTTILRKQLFKSCTSHRIKEGRGEFTLRRVLKKYDSIELSPKNLEKIFFKGRNNYIEATYLKNGGSVGLKQFAFDVDKQIYSSSSSIRGMINIFKRCMQRKGLIIEFYEECIECCQSFNQDIIRQLIDLQKKGEEIYSLMLSELLMSKNYDCKYIYTCLLELSNLEDRITNILLINN